MIKIIEEYDSKTHKNNDSNSSAMLSKHQSKTTKGATGHPRGAKATINPPNYRCHYCKRKGHKSAECFKRKRDKEKANTEKSNAEKANVTTDAFYANEARNATVNTYNQVTGQKWCLDSGCTSHLCKYFQLFAKSHEADSGIKLANETTARATATGVM